MSCLFRCCCGYSAPKAQDAKSDERPLVPLAAPRLGAQRLQRALDSFAGFQVSLPPAWRVSDAPRSIWDTLRCCIEPHDSGSVMCEEIECCPGCSLLSCQEILLKSWDESQLLSPKPEAVCHLDDETVRTATEFTLVLRGPYQHDCSSSNADETLDDDDSDQYFPGEPEIVDERT